MLVSVNMSMEVYNYFKGHDLSLMADALLEMFDFTNLPQITGKREIEKRINVSNQTYIDMYNALGPRSKKISLSRLFEYAYSLDVLSMSRFTVFALSNVSTEDTVLKEVNKAYKALLQACNNDGNKTQELVDLKDMVYLYKKHLEEKP